MARMHFFALVIFLVSVLAQNPAVSSDESQAQAKPTAAPEFQTIIRGIDGLFNQIQSHHELLSVVQQRIQQVQAASEQALQSSLQVLESSKDGQDVQAVRTLHHEFNERNKEILDLFKASSDFNIDILASIKSNADLITKLAKQFSDQKGVIDGHFQTAAKTLKQLSSKKDKDVQTLQRELVNIQSSLDQLLNQTKPKSFLDTLSALVDSKNLDKVKAVGSNVCSFFDDLVKGSVKGGFGVFVRESISRVEAIVSQAPDYVSRAHLVLKDVATEKGVPAQYSAIVSTVLITLPITVIAVIIVTVFFRAIRGLIWLLTCGCFRKRRSQPQSSTETVQAPSELNSGDEVDGQIRKRKSNAGPVPREKRTRTQSTQS